MEDIQLKFNSLDIASRKAVVDFIDRIIRSNQEMPQKNSEYKKRILSVCKWSDEDIRQLKRVWVPTISNPKW
jgi:hypothetical protein